jgi:hypothetical protein
MNSSTENFESEFNSFENYNNINAAGENLTENFSWISPKEPKILCNGVYCGIPMEKAFAKYENRNFTSTKSNYGFNAPSFNEKRSMKFKSLASEIQRPEYPKDKRGFSAVSSPSGFNDFEPIKGLYKDITLDGAIKSRFSKNLISPKSSRETSPQVTSPQLSTSDYNRFRSSAKKVSQRNTTSSSRLSPSERSAAVSSVISSAVSSGPSSKPSVRSSSPSVRRSKKVSRKAKKVFSSSSPKSSSTKSSSVKSSSVKSKTPKYKKAAKKSVKTVSSKVSSTVSSSPAVSSSAKSSKITSSSK